MGFKKDFVWGTATAAVQIEGAAFDDGKGLNVWDVYTNENLFLQENTQGLDVGLNASVVSGGQRIRNNDNTNVACDHYHRYKEDVKLMKEMGVKAYRFSISWSRLIPEGIGEINPKGAEFYNDLVDTLLAAGIEPYVTLFHWDYPQALENQGGWLNPDSPKWFADYAKTVVKMFGGRVKNYVTFNEPQCFVHLGYRSGVHPPAKQYNDGEMVRLCHHVLLAHGLAVMELRNGCPDAKISFAPCGRVYMPETPTQENIEAARKRYFQYDISNFTSSVGFWSDAVVLGVYGEGYLKDAEAYLPEGWEKDLKDIIAQPLNYYCQNLYNGYYGTADQNGDFQVSPMPVGFARTSNATGWYVRPETLYWGGRFLCERYKLPLYITENGAGSCDSVSLDGKVHDPQRIDYIHRYLLSLRQLSEEGYDIRGYFVWSLMDNFEWSEGYFERMGLIYVDFETLERIPKDSYYWYREVIKHNGNNL